MCICSTVTGNKLKVVTQSQFKRNDSVSLMIWKFTEDATFVIASEKREIVYGSQRFRLIE